MLTATENIQQLFTVYTSGQFLYALVFHMEVTDWSLRLFLSVSLSLSETPFLLIHFLIFSHPTANSF